MAGYLKNLFPAWCLDVDVLVGTKSSVLNVIIIEDLGPEQRLYPWPSCNIAKCELFCKHNTTAFRLKGINPVSL